MGSGHLRPLVTDFLERNQAHKETEDALGILRRRCTIFWSLIQSSTLKTSIHRDLLKFSAYLRDEKDQGTTLCLQQVLRT